MVNTMAKCSRSNKKAKDWLLSHGYSDIFFWPMTRWSKDLILQGLKFDGFCASEYEAVLFQVKSNTRAPRKVLAKYKEIEEQLGIRLFWINAVDRKPLEINNEQVL